MISQPPPNDDTDATKNAKEILQKVKDFLTTTDVEDMSLKDILLQLQLSQETYNTVLQTSRPKCNPKMKSTRYISECMQSGYIVFVGK